MTKQKPIVVNNKNSTIVHWFELLLKQIQFHIDTKRGKDKQIYGYKLDSIRKALDVIRTIDFKIKRGGELAEYKGIGKGTIQRIDEILETGKLAEVNDADISGKYLLYIEELEKIFGIGRIKAMELYKVNGITSIEDLKFAYEAGEIDLPENVAKGLKYVDQIKLGIPRKEVDSIYLFLLECAIEFDPQLDVRICGSYRREKELLNDIDVIVAHPKIKTLEQSKESNIMKQYIELLIKKKFIVESFTSTEVPTKFMGVCRYQDHPIRRIDIRFMPQESYYTAILYFTGSKDFNRNMRSIAKDMGYTLNEYSLLDQNEKPIPIKSEEHIFELLGMEYVMPKYRVS